MSDDFVDPNASISLLQTLILLEMHGQSASVAGSRNFTLIQLTRRHAHERPSVPHEGRHHALCTLIFRPPQNLPSGHRLSNILMCFQAYVNIARRTKIFLPKATPAVDPTSPDSLWRAAMLDETGRRQGVPEPPFQNQKLTFSLSRCAYALFLMDSSHAAMFHHAPCLSAFELRLDVPVCDAEWTAIDGETWHVSQCVVHNSLKHSDIQHG